MIITMDSGQRLRIDIDFDIGDIDDDSLPERDAYFGFDQIAIKKLPGSSRHVTKGSVLSLLFALFYSLPSYQVLLGRHFPASQNFFPYSVRKANYFFENILVIL